MAKSQMASKVRRSYQFIQAHQDQYAVKTMCRLLNVTRSGYYAWRANFQPSARGCTTASPDPCLVCGEPRNLWSASCLP